MPYQYTKEDREAQRQLRALVHSSRRKRHCETCGRKIEAWYSRLVDGVLRWFCSEACAKNYGGE